MQELSHAPGEVISYPEMCQARTASLQTGMNFHLRPDRSLILIVFAAVHFVSKNRKAWHFVGVTEHIDRTLGANF
jgi:hypothetical protein